MKGFKRFMLECPLQDKVIQWVKAGDNRRSMTYLAKSAVGTELHPGIKKVYRGVHGDSVDATKVGASWTVDKNVAAKYAGEDGKVVSTTIKPHIPAVDLSRLLPKKLNKDKEVFIAKLGGE